MAVFEGQEVIKAKEPSTALRGSVEEFRFSFKGRSDDQPLAGLARRRQAKAPARAMAERIVDGSGAGVGEPWRPGEIADGDGSGIKT
jgi:hypothetical protein